MLGNADKNQVSIAPASTPRAVCVEIRDTGPGLRSRSRRASSSRTSPQRCRHGYGLGLPICHGIVTALGGEMQIQSELGLGTSVRVLLSPAIVAPSVEDVREPVPAAARRGRILAIDDESMVLRAIGRMRRDHG
ncbi:MAG: ATP-binding protein [Kofleriaceae bacterium]